jgi:hypothetical protein
MSIRYQVEFGLKATVPANYDFEAFLDRFYEHLLELEESPASKIVDPDMSARLAEHTFRVEMSVLSNNPIDVQMCALGAIRTALHVAGAATPGWEVLIEQITADTRAVELQAV